MFTWDTSQPLPAQLRELLDRAGAVSQTSTGNLKPDALIFLPIDQVVSCGLLSLEGMLRSYQTLVETSSHTEDFKQTPILLNGSRLLALSSCELKNWQPGQALPKVERLERSSPLNKLLSSTLVNEVPELLSLYLQLDERSERGGAEVDKHYATSISTADPEKLIDELNKRNSSHYNQMKEEERVNQLLEIEQECERQFLLTQELAYKYKHTHRIVKSYENLVNRIILMKLQLLK